MGSIWTPETPALSTSKTVNGIAANLAQTFWSNFIHLFPFNDENWGISKNKNNWLSQGANIYCYRKPLEMTKLCILWIKLFFSLATTGCSNAMREWQAFGSSVGSATNPILKVSIFPTRVIITSRYGKCPRWHKQRTECGLLYLLSLQLLRYWKAYTQRTHALKTWSARSWICE